MKYVYFDLLEQEQEGRELRKADPKLAGQIYGEKEILLTCMNLFKIESGDDNRKFNRLADDLESLTDPCYLSIEDKDLDWVCKKLDTLPYDAKVKDQLGNEQKIINAHLGRAIARIQDKLLVATNKMPDELKKPDDVKKEKKVK